jgi:uncharacterized membrane protein
MEALPALVAQLPRLFGPLDFAALGLFLAVSVLMTSLIEHPPRRRPSVSRLMEEHRRGWMETFSTREMRIFDANLVSTLRSGTAFFASTCLIAIGGVAALLGQTERILGVVRDLGGEAGEAATAVWEAKLLVLAVLLVNAFLKFVWSHRLFGYVAVLMGAMPLPGTAADVERAASIQNAAARNFNRGLRAVYFTLAALAWFLGPVPFMAAVALTALMLARREFFSVSRAALMEGRAP